MDTNTANQTFLAGKISGESVRAAAVQLPELTSRTVTGSP